MIDGIQYVIDFKNANPTRNVIMNLSLGGEGISAPLNNAIVEAVNLGIVTCVAAGKIPLNLIDYRKREHRCEIRDSSKDTASHHRRKLR